MSVPINIIKVFPPPSLLPTSLSPLSESFIINTPKSDASHPSVMASLSGNLDDYDREETSDPPGWIFSATSKSSHRDRYHGVEERLSELEKEFQVLKKEVRVLRADKDRNEFFLIRSQLYTKLLSILQCQLFDSLPNNLQQQLTKAGWDDLPEVFVIWWHAWNGYDPVTFPFPAAISEYIIKPKLCTRGHKLFNRNHTESQIGILIREAWEELESDPVARDLMVYCWCSKK